MDFNENLLIAIALQIACRIDPGPQYLVRQGWLGGGTKLHLFFVINDCQVFTFNIFAGRVDGISDHRIDKLESFREILTGRITIEGAARKIARLLNWEVREPQALTYSSGLFALGILIQRFAFDNNLLRIENGYANGANFPNWLAELRPRKEWPVVSLSDLEAAHYWMVSGRQQVIFDLSQSKCYFLATGTSILFSPNDPKRFQESINQVEAYLRTEY